MFRTAFLFLCLEACINQPRASASNYCASLFALLTLLSKGTPKYEREASDSIKNDNELSDKTKNHDVVQGINKCLSESSNLGKFQNFSYLRHSH
jgi:hypothetical protein